MDPSAVELEKMTHLSDVYTWCGLIVPPQSVEAKALHKGPRELLDDELGIDSAANHPRIIAQMSDEEWAEVMKSLTVNGQRPKAGTMSQFGLIRRVSLLICGLVETVVERTKTEQDAQQRKLDEDVRQAEKDFELKKLQLVADEARAKADAATVIAACPSLSVVPGGHKGRQQDTLRTGAPW